MADYKKIFINDSLVAIKSVLDTLVTNRIIDHITDNIDWDNPVLGDGNRFDLYDENNKLLMSIVHGKCNGVTNTWGWTFTAYNSINISKSYCGYASYGPTKVITYIMFSAYTCKNGIIILIKGIPYNQSIQIMSGYVMITLNQNGIPVFDVVYNYSTDDVKNDGTVIKNAMAREMLIAPTDDTPIDFTYYNAPIAINQCILVPFFTFSQIGEVSYTPYAGRFIACNISSFIMDDYLHLISFNNAQWITNGYWALQI